MNYAEQLLVAHSRANADLVLNHVLEDESRVPDLLDVFLGGQYRTVQRSAMVVGDLGRLRPAWLKPWHGRIIAAANTPDVHDAVKRNVMRYFSELPITNIGEDDEGHLVDLAFRLGADHQEAVAIRVFALSTVNNYVKKYPELKDELRGVIEFTIAEGTTAAFLGRGNKILKELGT
ncbi:MAG: hypothetical protein ACJAZ9_000586 [Neolewinella sp.]|jgi:hypothetical protein